LYMWSIEKMILFMDHAIAQKSPKRAACRKKPP